MIGQTGRPASCEVNRRSISIRSRRSSSSWGSGVLQGSHRGVAVRFGLVAAILVAVLAGYSSASWADAGNLRAATLHVPTSAFGNHTGVTAHSVTVGNVSTLTAGVFEGAAVGTKAYAAYINSQGGVNGRKILVQSYDDGFNGASNKQLTTAALNTDFALVGSLSLEDAFGGSVLKANPGFPNVSEAFDPSTQALPNTFGALPAGSGWPLGPLEYFKTTYPRKIAHTATILASIPSLEVQWTREKAAMQHLGYNVVYDPALPASTTNVTPQVIAMKNEGVQILFLEQEPENYASAVFEALTQQNFHPVVVLGAPGYNETLVANSGGPKVVDGTYLEQPGSLYLGEDAANIPMVKTFDTWVRAVAPGFTPDFFTFEGWLSADLFTQALRKAGHDPSRGSLLEALRQITSFSSGDIAPVSDPASKVPNGCFLLARVVGGRFQRLDDPPITGQTEGFRCGMPYYTPPS